MVSQLKFYRRDPMYPAKNRGAGMYYSRGRLTTGLISAGERNPRGFRGLYYSKYTDSKDAHRSTQPTRVTNIGKAEEKSPHKGDYKTRKSNASKYREGKAVKAAGTRRKYVAKRKTTRMGEGIRGWF